MNPIQNIGLSPNMTANAATRFLAGTMLALSITLAWTVTPWFFLLTGFVGLNLSQYAFTGFCPALFALKAVGLQLEPPTDRMTVGQAAGFGAGTIVLIALVVSYATGTFLIASLVGGVVAISMGQSAFSGWCPMLVVARRAGLPDTSMG